MNTTTRRTNRHTNRITQAAAALGLALLTTLATLGSLDRLATAQHAATVLAKAAATQQAQAGARPASARS